MLNQIVTILITALINIIVSNWFFSRREKRFDAEMQKIITKNEIYLHEKQKALVEALNIIDDYISGMKIEGEIAPIIDQNLDEISLTLRARNCYNGLCIYCDSSNIIDLFNDIIMNINKEKSVFQKYIDFRAECRKEIGQSEMKLNEEHVFYSIVSTYALKDKRKSD